MPGKKPFLHFLMYLFLLLISGCLQQAFIDNDMPPEKILAAISGSIDESEILSAVVQIDLVTFNGYHPAKGALVIKKPSYLRLELLSFIGTPGFFLTVSPEDMNIFIPSKEEFYFGKPTTDNLKRFIPWPVDIEDMIMIFTGTYPQLKDKNVTCRSYRENHLLRIEMIAQSGNSQIIWVGKNNRLQKLVRKDEHGEEMYSVKYDHYEEKSPVAGEITISMADGITSVSIKYSELTIEKAMDLSIFNLPVPAKAKKIFLN